MTVGSGGSGGTGGSGTPLATSYTFVPALLTDNPHVAASYEAELQELDGVRRKQLIHGDWDAAAAGAVIDLMRETEVVLETLSAAPVPELRSGGLGVREAKRLSKLTGVDEQRLGFVLEVAAAAGLIASGIPDPEPPDSPGPCWTPTVAADRFLESSTAARWYLLASTWLDLPSRPSLIGGRGLGRGCGEQISGVGHRPEAGEPIADRRFGRG